jgi:hypothetical protein
MTSRLALAVAVFVMLAAPALAQTPRAGGELIFLVPSEPPSDGCAGGRSGGRGGRGWGCRERRFRQLGLYTAYALSSWSGIGLIIAGMTHQGWDVQLTAYAARDWQANFFPVGIAHSIVGGSAWERTPWRAVQRAAWNVLTDSMSTHFRIRRRFDPGRTLQNFDQPLAAELPIVGLCELKIVGDKAGDVGQDLALKSGPFDSEAAARVAGEKAVAALLLTSLRSGYAVSIQPLAPTGFLFNAGRQFLAERLGPDTVYDDSYGLTVFEEVGRTRFVSVGGMHGIVGQPASAFVAAWSEAFLTAASCNERVLPSYDLFASSRFENSSRARFLLLVMAAGALVEQAPRSADERALIERLLVMIEAAGLPSDRATALKSGVGALKYQSIGHACRTFLRQAIASQILTDSEADAHFSQCYRLRGRIVHRGLTPPVSELTNNANRMEATVRQLLLAAIEGRAVVADSV